MRIISTPPNNRDFYDFCIFMSNKNVVFNRNTNLVEYIQPTKTSFIHGYQITEKGKNILDKLHNLYNSLKLRPINFLIIGDSVIPYIIFDKFDNVKNYVFIDFDYNHYKKRKKQLYDLPYSIYSSIKKLGLYIDDNNAKINLAKIYKEVRKITDEPMINLSTFSTINPLIRSIGNGDLVNQLRPEHIIQELELYINKLNCQEKVVEMSNYIKVKSHGFDDSSFKKGRK